MDTKDRHETQYTEMEFDFPEEEKVVGYRRPEKNRKNRNKRKTMGLLSLCLCLLGFILLLVLGIYGIVNLAGGSLPSTILSAAKVIIFACVALGALALLIAVTALFLRNQKKGAAVTAIVISLLLLLLCGAAIYAYQYIFGAMQEDKTFQNLPAEDLNVVQVKDDGEIQRQTEPPESTVAPEEIEEKSQGKEIEWESLADGDLPEEVKEIIYSAAPSNPSYLLEGSEQISTFVLYGTDKKGSSDSIILLSVDRVHKKIKMISISRDSYVTIPQWGSHAKINYAYAWGGAQMAVSTLNYNFFLNVTDYITVDMDQLADIVDLVGGVEVELDWPEATYLSHFGKVSYGTCVLDGVTAVEYARIRTSGSESSEITRQSRQQEVLSSLMNSVSKMPMANYPELIRTCLGMCTTSFNTEELMDIALEVVQNDYDIESYTLLNEVDYWGGVLGSERYFYCVYDLNRASDVIYRIIYEDLYISGYPEEEEAVEP